MNPINVVQYIMLSAISILLIYNFIMEMNKTANDTIGDVVARVASEQPLIVLTWGILIGHIFWNG